MNKIQKQVLEFHEAFSVDAPKFPQMPDGKTMDLRIKLIAEEFAEFTIATNLVDAADALGDLLYVVFGACIAYGIDIEPIVNEIHRSNMTKVWPDGTVKKRADGKVLKPDTYSPADLAPIIEKQITEGQTNELF